MELVPLGSHRFQFVEVTVELMSNEYCLRVSDPHQARLQKARECSRHELRALSSTATELVVPPLPTGGIESSTSIDRSSAKVVPQIAKWNSRRV